jgi:hypothetical protein
VYDERVTDDLVERMHACLAEALERTRPQPFGSPVTVAEIYQDLVPYRNVRTELGFDMNADYEHTLLRLLSGEADLARLEPSEARDELRRELDSPNPNVGLFRKFAACDVWIAARSRAEPAEPAPFVDPDETWAPRVVQWLEGGAPAPAPVAESAAPDATMPAAADADDSPPQAGWTDEGAESELLLDEAMAVLEEVVGGPAPLAGPDVSPDPEGSESMAAAVPARSESGGSAASCAFCGSGLPARRHVKFCPFCGADQSTLPCVACGEPIDAGWKFCVACGSAAPGAAPA